MEYSGATVTKVNKQVAKRISEMYLELDELLSEAQDLAGNIDGDIQDSIEFIRKELEQSAAEQCKQALEDSPE